MALNEADDIQLEISRLEETVKGLRKVVGELKAFFNAGDALVTRVPRNRRKGRGDDKTLYRIRSPIVEG